MISGAPLGQSLADGLGVGALDLLEDGHGGSGQGDGFFLLAQSAQCDAHIE